MPERIKLSIEQGKLLENERKNNKLNSLINKCLTIENYINDINKINESIKNFKSKQSEVKLYRYEEEEIINNIKQFGKLTSRIFDSNIEFDENLIKEWLNNKKFTPVLLFRKSINGSTPKNFHEKCDNKGIIFKFYIYVNKIK